MSSPDLIGGSLIVGILEFCHCEGAKRPKQSHQIAVIASEAKQSLGILNLFLGILDFSVGILEFALGILDFCSLLG